MPTTVLSETRDLRGTSAQQDAEPEEFQLLHAENSERAGRTSLSLRGDGPFATTPDAALDLATKLPGPVVGRLLETFLVRDDEFWQDLITLDGFDE